MFHKIKPLTGVSPPPPGLPNVITLKEGYLTLSRSAGMTVREYRHCPLLRISGLLISYSNKMNSPEQNELHDSIVHPGQNHHAFIPLLRKVSSMDSPSTLVLGNVNLPSGRVADITLADGRVIHAGAGMVPAEYLDCTGLLVLPGAVDMHVHMRGGSQSAKEDWESGSMSALAGGVTLVVDQPNTLPPINTPGHLNDRVCDAREHSFCNFAINSSVTLTTPLEKMWEAGAMAFGETFFAPSSYGEGISDAALCQALRQIHALDGLATIHAEMVSDTPDSDLIAHNLVRSPENEMLAVMAVEKLNTAGCRLHFCHLSTKRSIDAASATIEVTPHHLFLSYEDFENADPFGKVNPPLRTEKERKHLWGQWDRIDVVASDHAPHTREEKARDFISAPSGIPGVETLVPLLLAEVMKGKITLKSVIEKTSHKPADLLGIPRAGFNVGDRADFALYEKIPRPITAEMLHSRCNWTPFEGHTGLFPKTVIMGGRVVYQDGNFFKEDPLWFSGKGFKKYS
jgi:dihydroorotase